MSILEFGLRHIDRPLMVRHHHCHEIAVDIAGWLDRHICHHLAHCGSVFREERLLLRKLQTDPPHIESVSLCAGDPSSADSRQKRTMSLRPKPWLPALSCVCGRRSVRTKPSLPPDIVSCCLRRLSHSASPGFPRYLLGRVAPTKLPEAQRSSGNHPNMATRRQPLN